MRRIALTTLAAFFLLIPLAQASETTGVHIENNTSRGLELRVHVHGHWSDYFLPSYQPSTNPQVLNGSCVRIQVSGDKQHHHGCQPTTTAVQLACNLPSSLHCVVHEQHKQLHITVARNPHAN